jgi:hypothetical protein
MLIERFACLILEKILAKKCMQKYPRRCDTDHQKHDQGGARGSWEGGCPWPFKIIKANS